MKSNRKWLCALGVGLLASAAPAGSIDTVWNAQRARAERLKPENAARVRALGATGKVAFFAVPAMSDVMRLEDTWPDDGEFGGMVRCVLAQDEWESCSFQLFSFEDMDGVELAVDLPVPNDLRVAKLWFQNGNAWVGYFDDAGLKLTPEFLLHDENLIRVVQGERPGNYARQRIGGKDHYVWCSGPKDVGAGPFDPCNEGFADAPELLPVALGKDAFKQFVLTLHPPKGFKPGVYKGKIAVTRRGETLATVPLAVCVLPFELPLPRTCDDLSQPYLHSCMGAMAMLGDLSKRFKGDETRARAAFRRWMQSVYDHSIFHAPYVTEENAWCVPMLREIGFPLDVVFGESFAGWSCLNGGGRLSYDQVVGFRRSAKRCHEFYQELLGHNNVLVAYGDEQGAGFVTCHREFFKSYDRYGIRVGCAGHPVLFNKGGYAYGWCPMAGEPEALRTQARAWHDVGRGPVGFYACQHTGSENPQFTRRQHGLLGYFNGLTMGYNYAFAVDPFNDRQQILYKPMAITYIDANGLLETFAYAGFREACDDIRYMTCLKLLCREAIETKDIAKAEVARKALQYVALIDPAKADLNAVRLETIAHILKVRKALGR